MRKRTHLLTGTAIAASVILPIAVSAQVTGHGIPFERWMTPHATQRPARAPGVSGTVASINGTIITLTGRNNTTYSVDASNAKVTKGFGPNAATAALTDVTTGAHLMVKGTVNDTNVTATEIDLLTAENGTRGPGFRGRALMGPKGVVGTVASINGTTYTLTGKDGKTYTIDTSKASLLSKPEDGLTLADIQTGDTIMVQGTVTDTDVAANRISDTSFQGRNLFNGKVTAINGSTITIQDGKGTSYTVNAANAKISKGFGPNEAAAALSDIMTDAHVSVVGTLNGSSVTAMHIDILPAFKSFLGTGFRGRGPGMGHFRH